MCGFALLIDPRDWDWKPVIYSEDVYYSVSWLFLFAFALNTFYA